MKGIINKENNWDHVTEGNVIEGPIKNFTPEKMATAIKAMNTGKAAGPSEVCAAIIFASGEVRISVLMELCQRMLDGKGMWVEWQTSFGGSNFQGKRKCMESQYIQRSKAVTERHKDC